MENPIFRKKSLDRISSPEALDDYLHVTTPSVWLILIAIIMLLVGMLIWSHVASIDSFATGRARVENGTMYIEFDNEQIARNVQSGMTVMSGETQSRISSVGVDSPCGRPLRRGCPFQKDTGDPAAVQLRMFN